ncbi:MAG TPA: isopentenyl-diphosphate delta-isomerase [Saprospiraceae bacterium]|nr:isopentenyl-diphosphate delta-isomerase [Saprospiraceae bacterium]
MKEKQISPDLSDRKLDHIELAFKADMANQGPDDRFYYEPLLAAHPRNLPQQISFLGKKLKAPLWVSSMTGGTEKAHVINTRLATACAKYGLGMGLGSCRPLLDSRERLSDFDIRNILGTDLPLYANLGIAQVEELHAQHATDKIIELVQLLKADGLIVHINPIQEWLQPEGDRIHTPPIHTLQQLLTQVSFPVIVKEVGQGMGPASILAALQLPIAAFEFAAHGGTNFSRLELLRSETNARNAYDALSQVGHSAKEMAGWINMETMDNASILCKQFIISGGIKDFLDGYYLMQKLRWPSVYGMASQFLKYATESQEALDDFINRQIQGLQLAHAYLRVK